MLVTGTAKFFTSFRAKSGPDRPPHQSYPIERLAAVMTICLLWSLAQADGKLIYAVEQQSLTGALTQFAEQTGLQLVYPSRLTAGIETAVTKGETPEDMLEQLLAGTDLMYEYLNANTITLREKPKPRGVNTMSYQANSINNPSPQPTLFKRITTLIAGAMLASTAIAADETTDEGEPFIEEIIVTAEKREENILDVPLTMTAFTAGMIEQLGMNNSDDLEQMVPGLQYGDTGEQQGHGVVMRGIGTFQAGNNFADYAVAMYVDGVYTLGTYGVAPNLFDVERIEVARGPQGTLNGRNSIAGSISYVNKRPTDEWDALVVSEFTDQTTERYSVAFGGPITENLSFRINGSSYTGDGAQKNIGLGGDYAVPDEIYYSSQLRFKTNRLDMNLRVAHVDDDGTPRSLISLTNRDRDNEFYCQPVPDSVLIGDTELPCDVNEFYLYDEPIPSINSDCAPGLPGFKCGDLKNIVNLNQDARAQAESDQISFSAAFDITDTLTVNYLYGDTEVFNRVNRDGDFMNKLNNDLGLFYFDNLVGEDFVYTESSHELRLTSNFDGRLNFIAGIYYYENDAASDNTVFNTSNPFRFLSGDDAAAAASPLILPDWIDPSGEPIVASNCEDFLQKVIWEKLQPALGFFPPINTPDPEGGYYLKCVEGDDHTLIESFIARVTHETKAIFVSGDYQINSKWHLSGGLRHTKDTKQFIERNGGFSIFDVGSLLGLDWLFHVNWASFFPDQTKGSWSHTIGHLSLEYTLPNEALLYGRVSTGYRAGGFNRVILDGETEPAGIKKETLTNFELGVKGLFMDSRLQLTTAAFYQLFEDYQLLGAQFKEAKNLLPGTSPVVTQIFNIPDSKIWGFEAEGTYHLNDRWRLSGYYNYLGSKIGPVDTVVYPDLTGAGDPLFDANLEWGTYFGVSNLAQSPGQRYFILPQTHTGNTLPQQPKHKFGLMINYSQPLDGDLGTIDLLSSYSYTGERFSSIANEDFWKIPGYGRLDLRGTWTSANERLSATLYVQNVLDEIGVVEFNPQVRFGGFPGFGVALGVLSDHRQVGLQLRWRPQI